MSETRPNLSDVFEAENSRLKAAERASIAWHATEDARKMLTAIVRTAGGSITVRRADMVLAADESLLVSESVHGDTLTFSIRPNPPRNPD